MNRIWHFISRLGDDSPGKAAVVLVGIAICGFLYGLVVSTFGSIFADMTAPPDPYPKYFLSSRDFHVPIVMLIVRSVATVVGWVLVGALLRSALAAKNGWTAAALGAGMLLLPLGMTAGPLVSEFATAHGGGRAEHSATLLADGRVLVAGGIDATRSSLTSTLLYEPESRSWTDGPRMGLSRAGHEAVLLPDGRVLVVGGDEHLALASAEIFDPGRNSWSPAGRLNLRVSPFGLPSTTVTTEGRVLAFGVADCHLTGEIYDPQVNAWAAIKPPSAPLGGAVLTALQDGTVLAAGGRCAGQHLDSAEIYDPGLDAWASTGGLTKPWPWTRAVRLLDGRVLVTGLTGPETGPVDVYDPMVGTWAAAQPVSPNIGFVPVALLLTDGRVLLYGDYGNSATVVVYDPEPSSPTPIQQTAKRDLRSSATLLKDGRVLFVGGHVPRAGSSELVPSRSAELYNPNSRTWESTEPVPPGWHELFHELGRVFVAAFARS